MFGVKFAFLCTYFCFFYVFDKVGFLFGWFGYEVLMFDWFDLFDVAFERPIVLFALNKNQRKRMNFETPDP